jgi:S-formylglutathione hydrolase FrmB
VVTSLLDAPLTAGLFPTAVSLLGALAGTYLLARREMRWWTRQVPVAVAGGVVVAGSVAAVVAVWRPFPDLLPVRVLAWTGVAVVAVGLAWARRRASWWRRLAAVSAVGAVLALSVVKVNAYYGYRPTLASALGISGADQVVASDLMHRDRLVAAAPRQPLSRVWRRPPGMPAVGRMTSIALPGRRSHFLARPAWLYLPPAYLGTQRARLPVLVLVAGQPGGPPDWVFAGRLAAVMDSFAAAHDGLAPVVVVPDATGSEVGNTLCVDSRLGAAETYLAEDVPSWLGANLDVDLSRLAIGGFSFGGTCALQLSLRRPDVYRTFLDVSGQVAPTLGDLGTTVKAAFGGDMAAYRRVDPLTELRTGRYPDTAGVFVVGRGDDVYRPQAEQVAAATHAAGMQVVLEEVPGEHSWAIATQALAAYLPWIAGRTAILDPAILGPVAAPTSPDTVTSIPPPAGG